MRANRARRAAARASRELPAGADGTLAVVRRYHVTTFGCQMNAHDSERIKGLLEDRSGWRGADARRGRRLVFNTCTIREKPDTKLAAYLGHAAARKREDPERSSPSAAATRRRSASGSSSSIRSSTSPSGQARSRTSASGSAPAGSESPAAASASTTATSPPSCRCIANAASRHGCRCRWAATRYARTASSRPYEAASRAGARVTSSRR